MGSELASDNSKLHGHTNEHVQFEGAHQEINRSLLPCTVQQALRVKWRVFGVFVCFDLYFVNYRSWQAEILQECAEGCIQGDLQKKIRQT